MKKSLKRFVIKQEYLVDVPTTKEVTITFEGSTVSGTAHGNIDHPEFTKLRDMLEAEGYISTWREVWNGDRVLKPFKLNNHNFKTGEKFCCACALGIKFEVENKRKNKKRNQST